MKKKQKKGSPSYTHTRSRCAATLSQLTTPHSLAWPPPTIIWLMGCVRAGEGKGLEK